jgi:DNA polymerase-3 subunit delta
MMGERQLVVVREAQDLDLKKEEYLAPLISYINQPQPSTILALCYKYKAPPAKLLKAMVSSGKAITLESKKKYESDMPSWITDRVKNSGYSISEKAANMLVEYLGTNLEKINNELGKLYINHPKEKLITENEIELYIGISKDYNIFEFQKALAEKNIVKSNKIVNYFALNPTENSIFRTLPMLFIFYSKVLLIHSLPDKSEAAIVSKLKINPFTKRDYILAYKNYSARKIQDIIGWIRECNVRSIGIENYSTDNGELLRELVFKILH